VVDRVDVTIRGDEEVLRALRALPRDANDELRDGAGRLAQMLMRTMRGLASGNRQARAAARTLRVVRDRFPSVEAGPEKRLKGSEFGATAHFGWYRRARYWDSAGDQYRPHRGRASYWFFLAQERKAGELQAGYREILDRTVAKWSA
jgi:hypothetical protein